MEGSMEARVEDEASSSSWMQMAEVMKMLQQAAVQAIEELGALQPEEEEEEEQGMSLTLQKLFNESGSPEQMSHERMKGKKAMDVRKNFSLSSWVVEMDKIDTNRSMEQAQWLRPSIYRVPEWLNRMTKREAYQPQVVSLGPFHNGEHNLQPMEEHKRRLMLHMVKRSEKPLAQFVTAIKQVAEDLQDAYDGLDEKWCGENTDRFVEVMVTDGAFLLEMMRVFTSSSKPLPDDYSPYDPIFSSHSILSLWARIQPDITLVENQIPLLALQTLEAVRSGKSQSNAAINKLVSDFLCPELSKGDPLGESINTLGLHPLDIFHKSFCGPSQSSDQHVSSGQSETLMLSAVELREAAVHIKKSNTRSVKDIDFNDGVLSIPLVEIDDSSERIFLNLMAFERLHCIAGNNVTGYLIFMDNIIDSERDVARLRDKRVLKNFLSSDKAAAQLFNSLGKGATLNPKSKVAHVQWKVAMHCKKPSAKLQASFKHTYMRNPWVFISGVAAVILLSLTILQTIYTIMPFYNKN